MIEVRQDLWTLDANTRCVTTNGTVTASGNNVMGGGCAREAAIRYPDAPRQLGEYIARWGNHVYILVPGLVAFPTKDEVYEPSTLERIRKSLDELVALTDIYEWRTVAIPRPGCGLGGLTWGEVLPLVQDLDDRFLIVDFPR